MDFDPNELNASLLSFETRWEKLANKRGSVSNFIAVWDTV